MKPNLPITEAVNNSSDILGQATTAQTSNNTTATSDSPKSTRVRTIQVSEETADAIELYLEIAKLYDVSYKFADKRVGHTRVCKDDKANERYREEAVDRHTEGFYPHITKMLEEAEEYITGSVIDRLMSIDYGESNDTIII